MLKRVVSFVLIVVFSMQCAAFSGTPERDLPPEIAGHVSIRSLRGLVRNLDRYTAASTKGTKNEIPAGFLSMMAMIYFPVPMDGWESDAPVNIVILDAETTDDMPFVAYFQAADIDLLTETLDGAAGWDVQDAVEADGFRKVYPIVFPGANFHFLADIGDGRVGLAEKLEHLKIVADSGWTPAHMADADVRAHLTLKNKHNPITRLVRDGIAKRKDQLIANVDDLGLQPFFSKSLAETVEKYGPEAAAVVDNIRYLLVDLRFVDGIAKVEMGVKFEAESLGDTIAKGMAASGGLDQGFAIRIPPGAMTISVSYPAVRVFPGSRDSVVSFVQEFVDTLVPGNGPQMAAAFRRFYDSKPGQTASGSYLKDGRNYTLSYFPSENPDETIGALVDGIAAVNAAWAKIIASPEQGFKMAGREEKLGDRTLYIFTEEFANPEAFAEMVDKIAALDPSFVSAFSGRAGLNVYMTRDDQGVMFGAGDLTRDEFVQAAAYMKEPTGENLFQTPAAEKLSRHIELDRGAVGFIDQIGLFGIYTAKAAEAFDTYAESPEANPFRKAMEMLDLDAVERKSTMAFTVGSTGEWLMYRFLAPAAAVNEIVQVYDEYTELRRKAQREMRVPGRHEYQDEDLDDFEEDENGKEAGEDDGEAA